MAAPPSITSLVACGWKSLPLSHRHPHLLDSDSLRAHVRYARTVAKQLATNGWLGNPCRRAGFVTFASSGFHDHGGRTCACSSRCCCCCCCRRKKLGARRENNLELARSRVHGPFQALDAFCDAFFDVGLASEQIAKSAECGLT